MRIAMLSVAIAATLFGALAAAAPATIRGATREYRGEGGEARRD